MPVDKLRTNGDRVETILHLAKVLASTRDRRVIENLLEPLVDRSLLSMDEGAGSRNRCAAPGSLNP